ncbi:hypothetical protein RSAG8_11059, partial [Rhizoctonia solani AG-8 WAC10335]
MLTLSRGKLPRSAMKLQLPALYHHRPTRTLAPISESWYSLLPTEEQATENPVPPSPRRTTSYIICHFVLGRPPSYHAGIETFSNSLSVFFRLMKLLRYLSLCA